uniref:Putative secreted protein n=1 Tax=Ixodes ricinus TaxID=34613 RepID=A0A6B0U1Q8_IXORI
MGLDLLFNAFLFLVPLPVQLGLVQDTELLLLVQDPTQDILDPSRPLCAGQRGLCSRATLPGVLGIHLRVHQDSFPREVHDFGDFHFLFHRR